MTPEIDTTIEAWLKAIDLDVLSATDIVSTVVPGGDDEAPIPYTPPRYSQKVFDETSPTDTSFSANTVFDTPVSKNKRLDRNTSSDCASQDASSDNTTIVNEYDEAVDKVHQDPSLQTNTINAYDQPGTITSPSTNEHIENPRLVSLTSCLQCILLNLPCSRTHPSCTRCIRNGHADMCLLHRRRFAFESGEEIGPVLLKVKGEDEAVWRRKVELRQTLEEECAMRQERENWVLPSVLDGRGGWRRGGMVVEERKGWPGEGEGRVVLKELEVEFEWKAGYGLDEY